MYSPESTPVFGPLFLLININAISDKLISLTRTFADDTTFRYSRQAQSQFKMSLITIGVNSVIGQKNPNKYKDRTHVFHWILNHIAIRSIIL